MTTLGTHNLLDGKAKGTNFATYLFFTEAVGGDVAKRLVQSHKVYVCEQQRDLQIAVARSVGVPYFEEHYKQSVWGWAQVTPHRGTYWLTNDTAKLALVVEHRINAAFPPYIRGEKLFRKAKWWLHTRRTLRVIKRLKKKGYTVHAGGDLNTPKGVSGYRGVLHETGKHYDRLGSTEPFKKTLVLSKLGSDHFRLKGWV